MIRVQNLTKRYGSFLAVDDISFHVEAGGVVGILGPNGAGKTTTIRILTCYMPATSGSASIGNADVFRDSISVRQKIGYLPESAPLYPEMRAREYLDFRGRLRGMGRSERMDRIKVVADRCWLGEFIDRPIGQLSKGMRQRVGLADAILHDPPVLILDEPTVGLDPNQIRETRNLIRELGTRHTILLSSHILHEVEQVCSRTIIIAGGKIVASGTMDELRSQISKGAQVIAEIKVAQEQVEHEVGRIAGVQHVECSHTDGWTRLAIQPASGRDLREELFQLVATKGWTMRELHREAATLEDFFIQATRRQREQRGAAA